MVKPALRFLAFAEDEGKSGHRVIDPHGDRSPKARAEQRVKILHVSEQHLAQDHRQRLYSKREEKVWVRIVAETRAELQKEILVVGHDEVKVYEPGIVLELRQLDQLVDRIAQDPRIDRNDELDILRAPDHLSPIAVIFPLALKVRMSEKWLAFEQPHLDVDLDALLALLQYERPAARLRFQKLEHLIVRLLIVVRVGARGDPCLVVRLIRLEHIRSFLILFEERHARRHIGELLVLRGGEPRLLDQGKTEIAIMLHPIGKHMAAENVVPFRTQFVGHLAVMVSVPDPRPPHVLRAILEHLIEITLFHYSISNTLKTLEVILTILCFHG